MTDKELDFIKSMNISDEEKIQVFKESKFKELEETTRQEEIKLKQLKEKTEYIRFTTNMRKHVATASAVEHIFVGLIDDYVEFCKNKNSDNENEEIEDIDYTEN